MKISKSIFIINFLKWKQYLFHEMWKFLSYFFTIHTYLYNLGVLKHTYKAAILAKRSDMYH